MNDFGTNPTEGSSRRGKKDESFGIVTVELGNGMRLDGYIILTAKNAGKLGISQEQLKTLAEAKKKGTVDATLHLQFGDREVAVAEAVEINFA